MQLQNKNRSPDFFHKHFKHTCTSYKIIKHVYQYFNNEITFHKSLTCTWAIRSNMLGGFLIKRFLLLSKRHLLLRAIEISFSILDLCLIIWLQLLISNNEKISDENCCNQCKDNHLQLVSVIWYIELRFLESRHVNTYIMKMISTIQC